MRTNNEWNIHNEIDTESIDSRFKCALGINHKTGRLQWCPGCTCCRIILLIPVIMLPIILGFILLSRLEKMDTISISKYESMSMPLSEDTSSLYNNNDHIIVKSDFLDNIIYRNEQGGDAAADVDSNNKSENSEEIGGNSTGDNNGHNIDEDSEENQNHFEIINIERDSRCIPVRLRMSETTDNEERDILKDTRTSFIPPDFVVIPPNCISQGNEIISSAEANIADDWGMFPSSSFSSLISSLSLAAAVSPLQQSSSSGSLNSRLRRSSKSGLPQLRSSSVPELSLNLSISNLSSSSVSTSVSSKKHVEKILPEDLTTSIRNHTLDKMLTDGSDNNFVFGTNLFWKNEGTKENIRKNQAFAMKKYMDTNADPCVDFYQYACGNWAKLNPIPKDKSNYDTFEMLRESLDIILRDLLTAPSPDEENLKCINSESYNASNLIIENILVTNNISESGNGGKNKNENARSDNDYDPIEMARLRKRIIKKRNVFEEILKNYDKQKRFKRVRSSRSVLNRNVKSHLKTYRRRLKREDEIQECNIDFDAISAELKAKFLYQSCMNSELLEERGILPLLDLMQDLGGWPVLDEDWSEEDFDWLNITAHLRRFNNDIFIVEWVGPDIRNSDENVIQFDQTSLGLPTRDYFLHESNIKYLDAYREFMTTVINMLGANEETASSAANEIVEFEKELARITSPVEERANISLLYKKMTISELQEKIPEIDWRRYLSIVQERQISDNETVVIYAIEYMENLVNLLSKTESKLIANYLLWRFIRHRINNLDDRFQEPKQKFFHVLFGREQSPPRWKNCVAQVNSNMGMALGAMFVRQYFDESSKEDTLEMTHELQQAFREILNSTDWLDDATRHLAELKVNSMSLKIGYPDFILDQNDLNEKYKGLIIKPDKYFENTLNVLIHVTKAEQSKLGEPVNKTAWQTAPAIVNAYYSRNKNQIMFPAGILQPPFYHRHFPRSLNYGGIGVVIGHEVTHGFDDKGRLFDRNGNIHKWWTDHSINGFHERARCIISQYGNYTVSEVGISVDGESTQGENIADNGGIRQAFHAYTNWVERNKINDPNIEENETLPDLNMTNKQLFFLNFAQVWCGAMRPEATRNKLKTAVHSPGKFRVIGTLSNSNDFAREFNCSLGSPMNPVQKCTVW